MRRGILASARLQALKVSRCDGSVASSRPEIKSNKIHDLNGNIGKGLAALHNRQCNALDHNDPREQKRLQGLGDPAAFLLD